MPKLHIAIPTKLEIHGNTVLCLMNDLNNIGYEIVIELLVGKSNIGQARSIMCTNWYHSCNDDDLFLFLDSDQTFKSQDIIELIKLNVDVACGVYASALGKPTCRAANIQHFLTGQSNDILYGATGLMLIRKPILTKLIEYIKMENNGVAEYWQSADNRQVIPFFMDRLIDSETLPNGIKEWLGEDHAFCWMVRKVGGTVKGHISRTIGHEVPELKYFYPPTFKSKKFPEKSIVYYTGNSPKYWSAQDVNTKGLGGSETAVVYLSKYWVKKGYKVIVYGNCEEGLFDDVVYVNHSRFNINDIFDIIVLWRLYGILEIEHIKARKTLIDIHDVPNEKYDILINYIGKVDNMIVRSNFHKNIFNKIIHEKIKVIPNGIQDKFFKHPRDIIKNKYKLIYASSYDRGLYEMLLWGFPLIKKDVPEAELHIYYGMELLSNNLKNKITPLFNQPGVFEHGSISQEKLFEEKLNSSIHYYIGGWAETDCISIKESVIAGCLPVVSNNMIFTETDFVKKIDGDPTLKETHVKAAKVIVKLLKNNTLYDSNLSIVNEYKNEISGWKDVSDKWLELF